MTTRVFVTGLGVISSAGAGTGPFWDDLRTAHSRFQELEPLYVRMKSGVLGGRVSAEAWETAHAAVRPGARTRSASVFAEFAALEAIGDAGLCPGAPVLRDALVCVGSSDGQADALEDLVAGRRALVESDGFSSRTISEGVAVTAGSTGPLFTVQNTCASANVAVSCALEMIGAGFVDAAVVGGCDPYSEKNIIGFNSLQAIGPVACAPFTRDRRYVTPSEGAGILILQSERSLRTDQEPYAEVRSTAVGTDAVDPTAPDPAGVAWCHNRALQEAGLVASDIGAVFAHGTGTKANDSLESELLTAGYPDAVVTAIKGTVGHMMGAAGAAGAVAACLALRHGLVPPTAVDHADVEPGLNLVTGEPRHIPDLRYVQNNAFGFGGYNAISIFGSVTA